MSLTPIRVSEKKIKNEKESKACAKCGQTLGFSNYVDGNSWLLVDGKSTICNSCIKEHLIEKDWEWDTIDHLCQTLDIPFIPKEFERLREINGNDVFPMYAQVFSASEFDGLTWKHYWQYFKQLQENKLLEKELPEINEAKIAKMQKVWGENYLQDELERLENLFSGILATQSINGALQMDQARKLCKMSLSIDEKIRAGVDFDKLITSYDKMIKVSEFTPKNTKNKNDIGSVGEMFTWLEKRGWLNTYYDNAPKDIVDEVLQNLQAFSRRLYTGESSIGEDITARIDALKAADSLDNKDNLYTALEDFDLDGYDATGYDDLINEEFEIEITDEDQNTRGI